MSKKNTAERELLFREKFSDFEEVFLFRKEKKFIIDRVHSRFSMSRDVFDSPEEAIKAYETLTNRKSSHYPINIV